MGFSRQKYSSGLPFPPPGDLPDPRIEPMSPALAGGCFTTEPPGSPTLHSRWRWMVGSIELESTVSSLTLPPYLALLPLTLTWPAAPQHRFPGLGSLGSQPPSPSFLLKEAAWLDVAVSWDRTRNMVLWSRPASYASPVWKWKGFMDFTFLIHLCAWIVAIGYYLSQVPSLVIRSPELRKVSTGYYWSFP